MKPFVKKENKVKNIIEYIIVFFILLLVCFFVNKGIIIKGLFMDDLYDWSWFRWVNNLYEFAFKIYEGSSRYRPVFETIQYVIYGIVDTDPFRFVLINKIYNTIVALFIYHFMIKLNVNKFISIIFSSLYLIGHYAYYQIGQGIGSLETDAILFSLITLYFAVMLVGGFNHDNIIRNKTEIKKNIFFMYLFFFILVFTHERYLGVAAPIVFSLIFMEKFKKDNIKNDNKKISNKKINTKINKDFNNKTIENNELNIFKIKSFIIFIIEVIIILLIRKFAIGKIVPAGTGGTYVEDTFKISECIQNCLNQVAIVFGINIGPEHLYGIDFSNVNNVYIKYLTYISIFIIIITMCFYLYIKIKNKEKKYIIDLLFLSFIAVCIGSSSVTIRVELRFVYISFTAALIYLGYVLNYISIKFNKLKYIPILLAVLFFTTRLPIEMEYRKYFYKIHCYVDQIRMNSLYDLTIGEYGLDNVLHNKKIYVQNNFFGMTNFYAEYFYKIYDKEDIGNKIILFNDVYEIINVDKENAIILLEDLENNKYTLYK